MRLKSTASCGMLGCETHGTATSRFAHAHEMREGEWEKLLADEQLVHAYLGA